MFTVHRVLQNSCPIISATVSGAEVNMSFNFVVVIKLSKNRNFVKVVKTLINLPKVSLF